MDLDITLVGADVPAPAPVLHQDGTSRDSDRCAWIWDLPNNGREGAPVSRRADPDSAAGGTRQSVTGEGKEEPAVDVFLAPATSAVAVQLVDLLRARGLAVDLYHPVAVTRYGNVYGFRNRLQPAKAAVVVLEGAWPTWLRASDDVSGSQATTWLDMEHVVDDVLDRPETGLLVLHGVDRDAFVREYTGGSPPLEAKLHRVLVAMPDSGVADLVLLVASRL